MNEYEEYAKFLNNCLSDLGISRSEAGRMFAKIAGISEESGKDLIYRYCQGTRRPGRGNAIFLAELLGCTVDEALKGQKSIAIQPTLRLTMKQKGESLKTYIRKLNEVERGALPLYNRDEFTLDALDYAIKYKNPDALKYLIENKICEFDNLYTELTHPRKNKSNIKLSDLSNIAFLNDDEELLEYIYPKLNEYKLIDSPEEPELYVTKLLRSEMKYFALTEEGIKTHRNILKHYLEPIDGDEKIFERNNKCVIKNTALMKIGYFNQHTNILTAYCNKELLPLFFDAANEFLGLSVVERLYNAKVKPEQLEVRKDGTLLYIEGKKKYIISRLPILDPSRVVDAKAVCLDKYEDYLRQIDIKKSLEITYYYYEHYDDIWSGKNKEYDKMANRKVL